MIIQSTGRRVSVDSLTSVRLTLSPPDGHLRRLEGQRGLKPLGQAGRRGSLLGFRGLSSCCRTAGVTGQNRWTIMELESGTEASPRKGRSGGKPSLAG